MSDLIPAALTWHTLGNSAVDGVLGKGAHSYGVIEFFTSGILVCYLFYLRGRFDEIHTRIRNSDGGQLLTAADFTVMVSRVPESWSSQQLREFFEQFGEVRGASATPAIATLKPIATLLAHEAAIPASLPAIG